MARSQRGFIAHGPVPDRRTSDSLMTDWSVIYDKRSCAVKPRHDAHRGRPSPPGENPTVSVDHYENFPVASLLCPPRLRPAVTAIYHFARTADDIADEGDARPTQRLADLAAYRQDLRRTGRPAIRRRWQPVFGALAPRSTHAFALPAAPAARPAQTPSNRTCATRPTPTARRCWTTAAARPTRWAGCCCTCTACTTRRGAAASRRHLHRAATDQLLAGPERDGPAAATTCRWPMPAHGVTLQTTGQRQDSPASAAMVRDCATGPAT
jgi:hypothetical protein